MRKALLVSTTLLLGALPAATMAQNQAPVLIPVQGYLTQTDGTPYDGDQTVRFTLYDDPMQSGVSHQLYTVTQSVSIDVGYFTVYLGDEASSTLTLDLFRDHESVFLGITVGADAEGTPRLQLATAPFAAFAQYCGDAVTVEGMTIADLTSESDPQVGTINDNNWCRGSGSQVICDQSAPVTSESDPQVGSLTNGGWCTTNGSTVDCTQTAPAAADHPHTLSCRTVRSELNNGTNGSSDDAAFAVCDSDEVVTGGGCMADYPLTDNFPKAAVPTGDNCICVPNTPCVPSDMCHKGGWGCISSSTSDSVRAYVRCCKID